MLRVSKGCWGAPVDEVKMRYVFSILIVSVHCETCLIKQIKTECNTNVQKTALPQSHALKNK